MTSWTRNVSGTCRAASRPRATSNVNGSCALRSRERVSSTDERGGTIVKKIRRVLFATDFSRSGEGAFRKAVELAKSNRAELLIAHVLGSRQMSWAFRKANPR